MDRSVKFLLPVVLFVGISAYFFVANGQESLEFVSVDLPQSIFPFSVLEFLTSTQSNSFGVFQHGGNGSLGYFDLNSESGSDADLTNQTLTEYICSGTTCNFTIVLDNDNYTSVSNQITFDEFASDYVYYVARDGSLRNISELGSIGLGNWNFSVSGNDTIIDFELAGGDGFESGIRDTRVGGSYWLDENGRSLEDGLVGYWKFGEDIVGNDFFDDFSDIDNWNDDGSGVGVNTSADVINFNMNRDFTSDTTSYDLGYTISDDAWVLRFKIEITDLVAPSGSNNFMFIGISDSDHLTSGGSNQNAIILEAQYGPGASPRTWHPTDTVNQPLGLTGDSTFAKLIEVGTLYVEMRRLSTTDYIVSFFADSEYKNLIESQSGTSTSGTTGLRYIVIKDDDNAAGGGNITGTLDDVQFWNGVSEVHKADKVADSSGNMNNGIAMNKANTTINKKSDCKFGNCIKLDGDDDYVNFGNSSTLDVQDPTDEFSILVWVRPELNSGTTQYILDKRSSSGGAGFYFTQESDETLQFVYHDGTDSIVCEVGSFIELNEWNMFSIVNNGSTQSNCDGTSVYTGNSSGIFLETLSSTGSGTVDSMSNIGDLNLGRRWDDAAFFEGKIDNFRFYDRELSAEEISQLYEGNRIKIENDFIKFESQPYLTSEILNRTGGTLFVQDFEEIKIDGESLTSKYSVNETDVYFFDWSEHDWIEWRKFKSYRKPIDISYSGSTITDYQVNISLDTSFLIAQNKMKADCSDILFTDSDETTQLNHFIESGCNDSDTQIWIKVPSISSSGKTIWMYYGNDDANVTTNASLVFDIYSDFSDSTLQGWADEENGNCQGPSGYPALTITGSSGQPSPSALKGPEINELGPCNVGMTMSLGVADGLNISLKYDTRATSSTSASSVTNSRISVFPVLNVTGETIYSNTLAPGSTTDTGWVSFNWTDSINLRGNTTINIFVWLADAWGTDYDQAVYMDNMFVRKHTSPGPSVSIGDEEGSIIVPWEGVDVINAPDWLDPRNKQEFKWRYVFGEDSQVNLTYLMTAHDPFVRTFVDAKAPNQIFYNHEGQTSGSGAWLQNDYVHLGIMIGEGAEAIGGEVRKMKFRIKKSGTVPTTGYLTVRDSLNNNKSTIVFNPNTYPGVGSEYAFVEFDLGETVTLEAGDTITFSVPGTSSSNGWAVDFTSPTSTPNYPTVRSQNATSWDELPELSIGALFSSNKSESELSIPISFSENRTSVTTNEEGLVAYWNLNEGHGSSVIDVSGDKFNGTISGAAWVDNSTCQFGSCLYFNGNDDISVPSEQVSTGLAGSGGATVSMWAMIYDMDAINPFFGLVQGANDKFSAYHHSSGDPLHFRISTGAGEDCHINNMNSFVNEGEWNHYIFRFDGSKSGNDARCDIIINGVERDDDSSGTIDATVNSALLDDIFYIGRETDLNDYFDGLIDEVRVYDRALSDDEVQQIYQTGINQQNPAVHFSNDNSTDQETLFATTNWKNVNHTGFNFTANQIDEFSFDYTFNNTMNKNFMYTLGTLGNAKPVSRCPTNHTDNGDGTCTFSNDVPSYIQFIMDRGSGTACNNQNDWQVATSSHIKVWASGDPGAHDCGGSVIKWDIDSIPDGSEVIDSRFKYEIDVATPSPRNCAFWSIENEPVAASTSDKFDDLTDGTQYVSNDATCVTTGTNKENDLGYEADRDIEDRLKDDWFALSIVFENMVVDSSEHVVNFDESGGNPGLTLEVTYRLPTVEFSNEVPETVTNSTLTYYDLDGFDVSGLKLYYKFDETSGDAIDYCRVLGSIDCELANGDGTVDAAVNRGFEGKLGSGYNFNNTNSEVDVPATTDDFGFLYRSGELDKWSANVWMKLNSTEIGKGSGGFFSQTNGASSGGYGVDWFIQADGTMRFWIFNNRLGGNPPFWIHNTASTGSISDTNWHMVTITYDHSASTNNAKYYIDGVLDSQFTKETAVTVDSASNHILEIGNQYGGSGIYFFPGVLDDFSLWDKELGPEEISDLYSRGDGRVLDNTTWIIHDRTDSVEHDTVPRLLYDGGAAGIWKFDEGFGLNVTDSSGNGNVGSSMNGPLWISNSSCKFGSCLNFDGTDDYINFGDVDSLTGTGYSYSFWMKPRDVVNVEGLFEKINSGYTSGVIALKGNDNIQFYGNSGSTACVARDILEVDEWLHVTIVHDGSECVFYINGAFHTVGTASAPTSNNEDFIIGYDSVDGGRWFDGMIDDFRIYSRPLTDDEAYRVYSDRASDYHDDFDTGAYRYFGVEDSEDILQPVTPHGAALHVRFDDNSTFTATDISGHGNDGTVTDASWTTGSSCKFVNCMEFDGTGTDDINFGSDGSIDDVWDGGGTYAAWIYPRSDGGSNTGRIFNKDNDGWDSYTGEESNGFLEIKFRKSFNSGVNHGVWSTGPVVPINEWTHFASVYDADSDSNVPTLYVNGISLGSIQVEAVPTGSRDSDASYNLLMGEPTSGTGYFDGYIDDALIADRMLSHDEVYELYRGGVTRYTGDLVGWWKFGEQDPFYQEDFSNETRLISNETWVSTDFKMNVSDVLNFQVKWDNTVDNIIYDLGSNISDEKWVLRFDLTTTSVVHTAPSADYYAGIGLFDMDENTIGTSNQDSMTFAFRIGDTAGLEQDFRITDSDNSPAVAVGADATFAEQIPDSGTRFMELKRTSATTYEGSIYSDPGYTNLIETETGTLSSGTVGLRYLGIKVGISGCCTGATDGLIDNIRFWNGISSVVETNVTLDSSGNGNTGNITNGGANFTIGKIGSALEFDAENDVVSIENSPELNSDSFTLTSWVNIKGRNGTVQGIIAKESTVDWTGFLLLSSTSGPVVNGLFYNGTNQLSTGGVSVPEDGNWFHVAFSVDESTKTAKLYVNGTLGQQTSYTGTYAPDEGDLTIGARNYLAGDALRGFFNGSVDNVKIWKRALSADEVLHEYRQTQDTHSLHHNVHRVAEVSGLDVVSFNLTDDDTPFETEYDQIEIFLHTNNAEGPPDTTPPTVSIQEPNNITYSATEVWFNATLDEGGSWCGRSLNGGANVSLTNSSGNWNNFVSGLSNGAYSVTVYCNDTAGNMGSASTGFTVDVSITTLTISGRSLYALTGLGLGTGTVLATILETGDTGTTSISGGDWDVSIVRNSSLNEKFTVRMSINDTSGQSGYYDMTIGSGDPIDYTPVCTEERIRLSGTAVDAVSGLGTSGTVSVDIDGVEFSNSTSFSGVGWEIFAEPCTVPGELYNVNVKLSTDDGKTGLVTLKHVGK